MRIDKIFYALALALLFLSNAFSGSKDLPDSISFKGSKIDINEPFYAGYFTTIIHANVNSFFEDKDGVLHITYVDNYKLFYFKSIDDGTTWSKEQIITGHEGGIFNSVITVDHNGIVFIAVTVQDLFNYANPTNVYFSGEFQYDDYCINNKTGSWKIEPIQSHDVNNNFGSRVAAIFCDANNNVHLIGNYYGWMSYGGTAWEWIRDASSDTWGTRKTLAEFTDAGIDRVIYDNYVLIQDSQDKVAIVAVRNNQDIPKLFYIYFDGTNWQSSVEVSDNVAVGWNRYDAVIAPNDHIYIAYLYNNSQNLPELKVSKDFGAVTNANINLTSTDTLNYFRIHCNRDGLFTMYLWVKNKNQSICFSNDCINWTDPIEISSDQKSYIGGSLVKTDTRSGYFSKNAKQLLVIGGQRTTLPYGPDSLYFGSITLEKNTFVENSKLTHESFSLDQNYPNPFNPLTSITYSIPENGVVKLKVFSLIGQDMATLVDEEKSPGTYAVNFDASNLSSGVYFYQIKAGRFVSTRKMILLK